jgi:tagatose-1,6-bisphosphate aldolase
LKDSLGFIYIEKNLKDNLDYVKNEDLHINEFKLMKDVRRSFFKLQIPLYIKNALVEVFTT